MTATIDVGYQAVPFAGLAKELATRWFADLASDPPVCLVGPGLWCKTPGDAEQLIRRVDKALVAWYRAFGASTSDDDRRAITPLIAAFDEFAAKQRASIERCLVGVRWENTRVGLLGLLTYVGVDVESALRNFAPTITSPRPTLKEIP